MTALVVRMVLSLCIVLGLLLLTARVAGKRYRTGDESAVKILQRQSLSRSSTVTVVSVGNRVLVLGTTEQQVRVLAELDPHELGADASHPAQPAEPAEPQGLYAVPEATPTDFARTLLAAQASERPAGRHRAATPAVPAVPAVAAGRPGQDPEAGALAGSLLSPTTWRQALQALTRRAS
ncbi:flagellar biosynthetic protein FliO [Nocardioides sp.]|uniref:flagellar biosynthetic protein FliO n=1 Tax=Nocardioides sp. TaxID=35761 RepID=UPI002B276C30|nr:flagellar biosynthetic protein FliO [Nocardioides sp.]